jgi:hypothetical protein
MHEFDTLVGRLCERYARYQSLLNEVADAIAARAEGRLLVLEPACGQVFKEIQLIWGELEVQLGTDRLEGGAANTSWALLESAMDRAAEQLSLNQAALAQWAGEVGAELQEARAGASAIGAYAELEP